MLFFRSVCLHSACLDSGQQDEQASFSMSLLITTTGACMVGKLCAALPQQAYDLFLAIDLVPLSDCRVWVKAESRFFNTKHESICGVGGSTQFVV